MEKKECEYNIDGKCYSVLCFEKGYCSVRWKRASRDEIISWIKSKKRVVPKITIMKPEVINKSFPSENVASE